MTIYLNAKTISGLGEDTFWTWMKRELGAQAKFGHPIVKKNNDIILQYSTQGPSQYSEICIALLWELYPEMKFILGGNDFDEKLKIVNRCAKKSVRRVVSSHLMIKYYEKFGQIDVLPIGVDTDLFKPAEDRTAIRKKYNLPIDKKIGFWCGTTHIMKGFSKLVKYQNDNPNIDWIVVWKKLSQSGHLLGAHNYIGINQVQLSELMSSADFFLCCGLLSPFFMVEWEAMACNLPMIILDNIQKDFIPSKNTREDIFRLKWDRKTTIKIWKNYLGI